MEYKGFEYSVLQTANPTGWKCAIRLDERRFKVGSAFSRASAVTFTHQAIEKHLKKSRGRNNDEPSMLDQTGFGGSSR